MMDKWDPIGVRGVPEAIDECDSYAGQIAAKLRSGSEADDIAAMLSRYRTDWMGLEADAKGDLDAAQAIVAWCAAAMRSDGAHAG
jgi:hypothetical protein